VSDLAQPERVEINVNVKVQSLRFTWIERSLQLPVLISCCDDFLNLHDKGKRESERVSMELDPRLPLIVRTLAAFVTMSCCVRSSVERIELLISCNAR
jgi:hypothetical protein